MSGISNYIFLCSSSTAKGPVGTIRDWSPLNQPPWCVCPGNKSVNHDITDPVFCMNPLQRSQHVEGLGTGCIEPRLYALFYHDESLYPVHTSTSACNIGHFAFHPASDIAMAFNHFLTLTLFTLSHYLLCVFACMSMPRRTYITRNFGVWSFGDV